MTMVMRREHKISSRPLHGDNAVNHNQQKVEVKSRKKLLNLFATALGWYSRRKAMKITDIFFH